MDARINDPGGVMSFGDGVTSARIRVRVKAPAEPKPSAKARAFLGQPGGYKAGRRAAGCRSGFRRKARSISSSRRVASCYAIARATSSATIRTPRQVLTAIAPT